MKTSKNLGNSKVDYLMILTILISFLVMPMPFKVSAVGATIYVPSDYSTIQYAIGNATTGDTIIVESGHTNYGSINVDKQLTVQGQNQYACIIDAMGSSDAVVISADDVIFKRFTLGNCTDDGVYIYSGNVTLDTVLISGCDDEGIFLSSSDNSTIENCEIDNCDGYGIYTSSSDNITIKNCLIYDCNSGMYTYSSHNLIVNNTELYNLANNGIYLYQSGECSIIDSEIHHCFDGMYIYLSKKINVNGCTLFNNTDDGIYFDASDMVNVFDCDIYHNSGNYGIRFYAGNHGSVVASRIFENEGRGIGVDSNEGFALAQCEIYRNNWQGISISDSSLTLLDSCRIYDQVDSTGIQLSSSDRSRVKNCTSYNNSDGIYVTLSDGVSICDSYFYDNDDDGVDIWISLKFYLKGLNVMDNANTGLEIDYSQGVAVNCNTSGNEYGLDIGKSVLNAHYCDIENNLYSGLYANDVSYVDASECWWGNSTGPYHWSKNPTGTGDHISDNVEFEPWQTELYQPNALISNLRCQLRQLDWRVIYPDQVTPKPLGCGAALTSDWLASAFVTTKLPTYVEGLDTNPSFVNQTTGEAVGALGAGVITFGGPIVNPVVKRAEDAGTPEGDQAPVKFYNGGDTFYFRYQNGTNIPDAELPLSVINVNEDLFLIETYNDGDNRLMVICYGFGWPGTYAAGKYFDTAVFPHLASFTDGWIVVHWEDSNTDGFVNDPGEGDTYTVIARG